MELINIRTSRNLPDLLLADATDYRALCDMFSETSIVINCTGPFKFFGKEVVEACMKAKCTYMDLSSDPQFIESCMLNCYDRALENNVLILNACAFDSVPVDLGCLYTTRQFPTSYCNSIRSFLTVKCPKGLKGYYTTYACSVHGSGDKTLYKEVKKLVKTKYKHEDVKIRGPILKKYSSYAYEKTLQCYVVPFFGSDTSIIRSTQRTLLMTTKEEYWPQYNSYITVDSIYNAATASLYESVFTALSSSPYTRSLIIPTSSSENLSDRIFSKEGPNIDYLENTTFEIYFIGRGYGLPFRGYVLPLPSIEGVHVQLVDNSEAKQDEQVKHNIYDTYDNISSNHDGNSSSMKGEGEIDNNQISLSQSIPLIQRSDVQTTEKGTKMCSIPILPNITRFFTGKPKSMTNTKLSLSSSMNGDTSLKISDGYNDSNFKDKMMIQDEKISIIPTINDNDKDKNESGSSIFDREVHVVVKGPEPGYISTPAIIVALMYCVLEERHNLPLGGVFTPAAAFYNCPSIFKRLEKVGITFTIVADLNLKNASSTKFNYDGNQNDIIVNDVKNDDSDNDDCSGTMAMSGGDSSIFYGDIIDADATNLQHIVNSTDENTLIAVGDMDGVEGEGTGPFLIPVHTTITQQGV